MTDETMPAAPGSPGPEAPAWPGSARPGAVSQAVAEPVSEPALQVRAPGPGEARPPASRSTRGRLSSAVIGAVVGGLVGALAAGGVFLALDDDATSPTVVRPSASTADQRESTRIQTAGDIASIIAKAEPAVVAITTGSGPGTGSGGAGTGFVISPDGFVVTNNHVVQGATRISVVFTDGATRSATIVGRDPSADLAVLKVDATGLQTVELGDSDSAHVGDDVVAIGNALALEGGLSVTQGIISGTNRNLSTDSGTTLVGMLQTDAAINPGNSGGPLLDAQGRVIGINTAIANPASAQNVGFAIPISRAKPTIENLRAGRKPAFLGVSTQDVTAALAQQLNLGVKEGAYVSSVTTGSPAAAAGVRRGDVIVEIGTRKVATSADVAAALGTHQPGDTVKVVVDRNGSRQALEAKLVARPDAG